MSEESQSMEKMKENVNQEEHYEVNIGVEKENVIFKRKEIKGYMISTGGTPSKAYLISYLSSKYKVPETHIDLKYIVGRPRRKVFDFFALIYSEPIKKEEEKTNEGGE